MAFFTENPEEIAGIIDEDYIKDVYEGKFYDVNSDSYISALFVNLDNPYRINHYFEKIKGKYGIEGCINEQLASYYMQGDIGNENYIILLLFLLLSFIFAIIGVGIIRNTIQLHTIEQIKDYGIMRCVGASQGELRRVIFRIGFIQEMCGIIVGTVLGLPFAMLIGVLWKIKVSFQWIALVYVLVVFIGDLYFVMIENSKLVKNISPIDAVRSNGTAGNNRIKARSNNVFELLFGFDTGYAYRSLMSNKNRFYKTVAALAFAITAMLLVVMVYTSFDKLRKSFYDDLGEYQVYFLECVDGIADANFAKSRLPSENELKNIAETSSAVDVRPVYAARFTYAFADDLEGHLSEEYLRDTDEGYVFKKVSANEDLYGMAYSLMIFGYEEDEYREYEDLLVEGTLNVSENGIVMVRNGQVEAYNENDDFTLEDFLSYECNITDYKVGDEIRLVDIKRLQEEYKAAYDEYVTLHKEEIESGRQDELEYNINLEKRRCLPIYSQCVRRLIKEGAYKTYVVEGVVESKIDGIDTDIYIPAIVSLDRYCEITGLEKESAATGIKYKFENFENDKRLLNILVAMEGTVSCMSSLDMSLLQIVDDLTSVEGILVYVAIFVIFILLMCSLNIINTNASNIYQRRAELAQLKIIGVSQKRIYRIVILEGVLTAVIADIIGIGIGIVAVAFLKKPVKIMLGVNLDITSLIIIAAAVILYTFLLLCGSIYVSIKKQAGSLMDNLR